MGVGGELIGAWWSMGLFLKRIEHCITIKFTGFINSKFNYKFLIFIGGVKIPNCKLKSGESKVGAMAHPFRSKKDYFHEKRIG